MHPEPRDQLLPPQPHINLATASPPRPRLDRLPASSPQPHLDHSPASSPQPCLDLAPASSRPCTCLPTTSGATHAPHYANQTRGRAGTSPTPSRLHHSIWGRGGTVVGRVRLSPLARFQSAPLGLTTRVRTLPTCSEAL
ncbi:hypothetical protein Pcinc_030428 [Petrolisthes cinctipes]|uniref:Uncharacterized protein n=1 Tax=Petrolisthes cinctipes TaxID=88211 RepID=A0AAE1EZD1_PETCI|nr:hypothetical protein Pcinc_030428 [Petrolisthes cinctipes]